MCPNNDGVTFQDNRLFRTTGEKAMLEAVFIEACVRRDMTVCRNVYSADFIIVRFAVPLAVSGLLPLLVCSMQ